MTGLETLTLILQGLVPLALIAWAARPHRTRRSWALDVSVAGSYLVATAIAGLWLALPHTLALVYGVLLVGAAVYGTRRRGALSPAPPSAAARLGVWGRTAAVMALVAAIAAALAGRRAPQGDTVDLAFPLSGGTYLIAAGGSNEILNPHRKTASAARYRPWVGQSHAIDVVRVGSWGSRDGALSPDGPSGFAIFGDVVTAPCAGTVLAAVDGHPDGLVKGAPSDAIRPAPLEGNHVILECGEVHVVLAHLQRGSVCVLSGDLVRTGDPLGRVGNSGQSDEPHLHIHAQTPGTKDASLGGHPIPMTFDGRYLVRNDRVRGAPEYEGGHAARE